MLSNGLIKKQIYINKLNTNTEFVIERVLTPAISKTPPKEVKIDSKFLKLFNNNSTFKSI